MQDSDLVARIQLLEAERDKLKAQLRELAEKLFHRHFANIEPYLSRGAEWTASPTPEGLILQIDGMTTGLYSVPDDVRKDAARLKALLTAILNAEENAGFLQEFTRTVNAPSVIFSGMEKAKYAIDHCVASLGTPKAAK